MTLPALRKRLTWDPVWPLPYESGWSVFSKILAYNNLALPDLVRLIRRRNAEAPQKPLNLCDSSWIDFERYAELLAIDPERLHTGFWDRIDMPAAADECYAIRHCPACWMFGYHCLLFDLAGLSTCPWHGCELTEPCASCATRVTVSPRVTIDFENERACPQCHAALPNFARLFALEKPGLYFRRIVRERCQELIGWFAMAREKLPESDVLLQGCLLVGQAKQGTDHTRRFSWPLGRAQMRIGELPPWTFRYPPVRVRYGRWKDAQVHTYVPETDIGMGDEAGRLYRSIRHQIYRRYVRPHRDCLCTLRSCGRDESLSLDAAHVCVVSLAFLVWRMSIEGLVNIEGLRHARTYTFALRLMAPDNHANMPPESRAQWSYFGFFGIWEELTRLCQTRHFRVIRNSFQCTGYVHWKFANAPRDPARPFVEYGEEPIDCHVLYPDPAPLIAIADKRCSSRKRNQSMVNSRHLSGQQTFNWARNDSEIRDYLFQLPHSEPTIIGQYHHVDV